MIRALPYWMALSPFGLLAISYMLGGLVIAQSEETAKFDGMPRSAIETGLVDFTLSPEAIPDVLLSGDHQKIAEWRLEKAKEITRARRPDLWKRYCENGPIRRGNDKGRKR